VREQGDPRDVRLRMWNTRVLTRLASFGNDGPLCLALIDLYPSHLRINTSSDSNDSVCPSARISTRPNPHPTLPKRKRARQSAKARRLVGRVS
jgi:hypothetical protein